MGFGNNERKTKFKFIAVAEVEPIYRLLGLKQKLAVWTNADLYMRNRNATSIIMAFRTTLSRVFFNNPWLCQSSFLIWSGFLLFF